jgi:hypothetical protein
MSQQGPRVGKLSAIGALTFAFLAGPMAVDYFSGDMFSEAVADSHGGKKGGAGGGAGKGRGGQQGTGAQGGKGRSIEDRVFRAEPDDDSDRPDWAGVKGGKDGAGGGRPPGAGTPKGDLYGDMVVLFRNDNGEPILNDDGTLRVVAYIYDDVGNFLPLTDSNGNLVAIPYNEEGDLVSQMTLDGVTYTVYSAEVEFGRLSVARSPSRVLDHALDEALSKLTAPSVVIGLDPTGRLTVDGVTIDSPLENLALYEVYMTTGTIPGVTLPAGFNPASLFAAAADKTGTIIVDTVVYMNSVLGVNSETTYYDFSSVDYDREATWINQFAIVLVLQPDGTYAQESVNLYEVVFGSTDWVDPTPTTGGADDFTQAADDYLQVIEFVHDNAVR